MADLKTLGDTVKRESLIEKKIKEEQQLTQDIDFDDIIDETDVDEKKIVFVYGDKNDGKTVVTYGLLSKTDTALVLSFDSKSKRPLTELPFLRDKASNINVVDASKYYNKTDGNVMLATSETTYVYVNGILDRFISGEKTINGEKPDWIIIDGTERMNGILENVMRKRNGIRPFDGVQIYLWKERRQYIDNIHMKCMRAAKKGVIYTSYCDVKEIIDNCTVVKRKEMPKWFGMMREETDIEIRAISNRDGKTSRYIAKISGSKYPSTFPDGEYDVTGRSLIEALHDIG